MKVTSGVYVSHNFPAGLRVLVVDDDTTYLMILEKMLRNYLYEVSKCDCMEAALALLGEKGNDYDIVIIDVHMPDMDGFKLLEKIVHSMDLPVIMMSVDDNESVVMKCVTQGACDYLIKPVSMEALKNIWQHVVRKKKHVLKNNKDVDQCESVEDGYQHHKPSEDVEGKISKKRKNEEDGDGDERDDTFTLKKPRIVWTVELHQQFMAAVAKLGIDKVVPKKILELMNVPGLTRENIASHLQKYRSYIRRVSGKPQDRFSSMGHAVSMPVHNMKNPSIFENSPEIANLNVGSEVTQTGSLNPFSQPSSFVEILGARGFVPGYDLLNGLHHQNSNDWGQNIGSTFDISQNPTFHGTIDRSHSGFAQQCFFSSHNGQQHPTPLINPSTLGQLNPFLPNDPVRIKAERVLSSSCQNDIFSEQYGQDDLIYAFLKQPDSANSIEDNFGFDTV